MSVTIVSALAKPAQTTAADNTSGNDSAAVDQGFASILFSQLVLPTLVLPTLVLPTLVLPTLVLPTIATVDTVASDPLPVSVDNAEVTTDTAPTDALALLSSLGLLAPPEQAARPDVPLAAAQSITGKGDRTPPDALAPPAADVARIHSQSQRECRSGRAGSIGSDGNRGQYRTTGKICRARDRTSRRHASGQQSRSHGTHGRPRSGIEHQHGKSLDGPADEERCGAISSNTDAQPELGRRLRSEDRVAGHQQQAIRAAYPQSCANGADRDLIEFGERPRQRVVCLGKRRRS